uniref:Uncharacterized protein n=1 Tax=Lotus japonicus TaxID=34305 RepID=I3SVR7_LOTJA|nr:unknown [Lotus japonicus]
MLPLRMTLTLLGHQQRPFQKSELRSKPLVDNSSRVQPYILQENQFPASVEVAEHIAEGIVEDSLVEDTLVEGTLLEDTLVQGTLVEGKRPSMDTPVEEEHQLVVVADDRSSSC